MRLDNKERLSLLVLVEESCDYIFAQGHSIINRTMSGDITPEQHLRLLDIHKQLTDLLIEQIEQNL